MNSQLTEPTPRRQWSPAARIVSVVVLALAVATGLFFGLRALAPVEAQSHSLVDAKTLAQRWADQTLPESPSRKVTWVGPIIKRTLGTNTTIDIMVSDEERKETGHYRLTLDLGNEIVSAAKFIPRRDGSGYWEPIYGEGMTSTL